jgi:hypothetical protein
MVPPFLMAPTAVGEENPEITNVGFVRYAKSHVFATVKSIGVFALAVLLYSLGLNAGQYV